MSCPSRYLLAVCLTCVAACATPGSRTRSAETDDHADRDARLQELVGRLARPPLGTGAVLSIAENGRIHTYSAGTVRTGGPAVTADTPFQWASVSKLLTAARVVTLAHEGRLGLDDTVRRHLPGVTLLDERGHDRAAEITLRQLLSHRAGLPHQPPSLDPAGVGSSWDDPDLLRKLSSSWSFSLVRPPGAYGYSNLGYALLAAVIEEVEGRSFATAMEPFLHRLGMTEATFWPAGLGERAARGRVERDGSEHFLAPEWYGSRYALPFTGLWATSEDLVRFGQTLIAAAPDERAPLHAMATPAIDRGHGPGPVVRTRHGHRSLEHDGAGPGFTAWFVAVPDLNLVVALACNADGESGDRARQVAAVTDEVLALLLDR